MHTYIYIYLYTHIHMHTHLHTQCICICIYKHAHVYTPHTCTHMHTHKYAYINVHTHIHMCTDNTHVHLYTNICTHMHSHWIWTEFPCMGRQHYFYKIQVIKLQSQYTAQNTFLWVIDPSERPQGYNTGYCLFLVAPRNWVVRPNCWTHHSLWIQDRETNLNRAGSSPSSG